MHDVQVRPPHFVVEATLAGFLTLLDVQRYAAEVEPVIASAATRGGYLMLIDVAACAIQSQEVVAAFQQHVSRVPRARRCAVVTGSSIIRMQIRRIVKGTSVQVFGDRADALAWLTAPSEHAASRKLA